MRKYQKIITFLLFFIFGGIFCREMKGDVTSKGKDEIFLETSVKSHKVWEGERVIYETRLFTTNPEVSSLNVVSYPDFGSLPSGRVAADNGLSKERRNGKDYYTMVIDRYFLGAEKTGKIPVKGGIYRIGVNRKVRVNDPFWGPAVVNRTEPVDVMAPELSFKITPLPEKGRPEDFSGAVGNFEIALTLPDGEIPAGENIRFTVSISGTGDLTNVPAPDVRQAFREGLHFRSMTDDKQHFITKGSLGSEMLLDCVFSAEKPGTYTILPVTFTFFNPETKRYETIRSDKMEITVGSGVTKGSPPVFHNI